MRPELHYGQHPQIVLFIGGNLLNASPMVSVTSFTQRFKGPASPARQPRR